MATNPERRNFARRTSDLAVVEPLWTVETVARYLGCSKEFVYRASNDGRLPKVRGLGALVRFDPKAIRAFLSADGRK